MKINILISFRWHSFLNCNQENSVPVCSGQEYAECIPVQGCNSPKEVACLPYLYLHFKLSCKTKLCLFKISFKLPRMLFSYFRVRYFHVTMFWIKNKWNICLYVVFWLSCKIICLRFWISCKESLRMRACLLFIYLFNYFVSRH